MEVYIIILNVEFLKGLFKMWGHAPFGEAGEAGAAQLQPIASLASLECALDPAETSSPALFNETG